MSLQSPVGSLPDSHCFPLRESEIRLLMTVPGDDPDHVQCQSCIANLDSTIDFETLSYAWGNPDNTRVIDLDGHRVEVTANLYTALLHLRHRKDKHKLMWIDALCINQSDEKEKTLQVNMMRRIYRQSSNCIIWLGTYDDGLEHFSIEEARGAFDMIEIIAGEKNCSETPHTLSTNEAQVRAAEAVKAMVHAPWWSRIWTVQEAVLPKSATVMWGSLSISWDLINRASDNIVDDKVPPMPFDYYESFGPVSVGFTSPVRGLKFVREEMGTMPVLDLLWRFRYRDATDPRDKIYGLMGLMSQTPFQSVQSCDYALAPVTLYRRITLDLLRMENGLTPLIGRRGEPRQIPRLPTWTIDWSPPNDPRLACSRYWSHINAYHRFNASDGMEFKLVSSEDESVLTLEGICIDKIIASGTSVPEEDQEAPPSDQTLISNIQHWEELTADIMSRRPDKGELPGRSWRNAFLGSILGDFSEALLSQDKAGHKFRHEYPNMCSAFLAEGNDLHRDWIREMTKIQVLLLSENGYVGLGPPDLVPGDELWVLAGGRVPFVLRPIRKENKNLLPESETEKYELVGDSFVFGIMEGEAVSGEGPKRRKVRLH